MKIPGPTGISERGEGSMGNVLMLILTALLAMAAFNAGPVFMKNFELSDKLTNISRTFPPGETGNESAREAVASAIEEIGMTEFLTADDCTVTSQGGIGGTRTVKCVYTREYKLLPGMVRKYTFEPSATSPTF